ncbi:MAG: D-alanyl-D-alanine carboxypeptidase [Streptosporangiales bacterium]|nr:D-alanyl-D-alanine carboxypeptidase [Streptosporangiales bacterium]
MTDSGPARTAPCRTRSTTLDHTPGSTLRRRDHVYQVVVRVLAVMLLPAALLVAPRRSRLVACRWALSARFPAECLAGLAPAARAAFEAARTEALWRDGELIGLTSGHRDAREQTRLFAEAVRRTGSPELARRWVLPPEESRHVSGTAMDVRPTEGARWLERHGRRYGLYRVYENEWWHFEYHPEAIDDGCPPRYADPTHGPRMRR